MAANGKGKGKKPAAGSGKPDETAKAPNGKSGAAAAPAESDVSSTPREAAKGAPEVAAAPAAPAPAVEAEAEVQAAARTEEPAVPAAPPPDVPRGAAWGHPLARFDHRWTKVESSLLTFVLIAQILSLVAWVFLNGLTESVTSTAGVVFRVVILAATLGLVGFRASRVRAAEKPEEERDAYQRNATLLGMALGLAVVLVWRRAAAAGAGPALSFDGAVVKFFDNTKGWLQEGSTLTLLGGLRGLGTRLTLWLALLGGSLATASGKHIHVDVVFRFLPKKLRLPVTLVNYLFAASVCFAAVWGFFDHIAIESYGSRSDDTAGAKIENAAHHIGNHLFFVRKQIGLDLRTLPHVLSGERYDEWMGAAAWNEWVDGAGYEPRFDAAKVKALRITEGTHPPFVQSPDGETTRSCLAHTLGLVFPFGLLAIGLRFLLRALLTLSGHYAADPDDAHREEIGQHAPASSKGAV
jgi:hypothetical protein